MKKISSNKLAVVLILLLAPLLVWVTFFWAPGDKGQIKHELLSIADKPMGGNFVVDTVDGTLALEDLRGKLVILYFGYTLCPDICPTSLALLSGALNQMDEFEIAQLQPIFISVDPERDNITRLAEYTEYFHPSIIGATTEEPEIKQIAAHYGAAYRKVDNDSAAGYLVDHTSYTYVIDRRGKLRFSLEHGTGPDDILAAVRELLAEGEPELHIE